MSVKCAYLGLREVVNDLDGYLLFPDNQESNQLSCYLKVLDI
jgi:hypothetical protein